MDTRIDHGFVWIENQLRASSILIRDGKIIDLLTPEAAIHEPVDQIFNAEGCWILPGGVDFHVHVSDGIETFENGTRCAAAGGITTVLDMSQFHGCVSLKQLHEKTHQINILKNK